MRFLVAVMCVAPLALAVVSEAVGGNSFARGVVIGFMGLFGSLALFVTRPTRPLPRKADPAKIARLERELGIVESPPPREGALRWDGGELWAWLNGEWRRAEANVVDTEAATTPFERPHMDPPTFHGAPTFGHKIEGP